MNKEDVITSRPLARKVIIWVALCVIALGATLPLLLSRYIFIDGRVYTLVPDYENSASTGLHCMAFMPSCGYCIDSLHPEKDTLVQNGQCYRAL